MSLHRLLARRLALSAAIVWLVLSAMFVLITVAPDARLGGILGAAAYGGANVTELQALEQQYLETYGFDRPIGVRYVDWMTTIPTFQWGESFTSGEPVRGIVADRLLRTLQYVFPATVLATVGGVAVGVYGSLRPQSPGGRVGRVAAYLALAVPNFYLAYLLAVHLGDVTFLTGRRWVPDDLWTGYVFPTVLLSTTLAGALVSYTRASANEYVDTPFVKLVRAKGGSEWRVASHVLKNAAPPLFALLFAELLAALLVAVFVIETVFGIYGFGALVLTSVYDRDVPVLLAVTYVVVLVGVFGNVLQDLVSATLDPRTGS
jgi:peptide/nickel transport system permease protein